MNCEEAESLLSSSIAGELSTDDSSRLNSHLVDCESCRLSLVHLERQDADLRRAFQPRRETAAVVADRVIQTVLEGANFPNRRQRREAKLAQSPWAAIASAAAAGFILAWVLARPFSRGTIAISPPLAHPIARLSIATGEVFTCSARPDLAASLAWREHFRRRRHPHSRRQQM